MVYMPKTCLIDALRPSQTDLLTNHKLKEGSLIIRKKMEYKYDASGVYFSYFLLSLLGIFLLPVTWMYISYIMQPTGNHDAMLQ